MTERARTHNPWIVHPRPEQDGGEGFQPSPGLNLEGRRALCQADRSVQILGLHFETPPRSVK